MLEERLREVPIQTHAVLAAINGRTNLGGETVNFTCLSEYGGKMEQDFLPFGSDCKRGIGMAQGAGGVPPCARNGTCNEHAHPRAVLGGPLHEGFLFGRIMLTLREFEADTDGGVKVWVAFKDLLQGSLFMNGVAYRVISLSEVHEAGGFCRLEFGKFENGCERFLVFARGAIGGGEHELSARVVGLNLARFF